MVTVERARDILEEQASEAAGDQEVEVLYAVAGETGAHEAGVWLIKQGQVARLV